MVLDGIKIVDFTEQLPGPLATQLLVNLGATVIKVERPDGDPMRSVFPQVGAASAQFGALNRGKHSIAVDLKRPKGLTIVRQVTATADVVLESFRPGVAERLGIGYEQLRPGHQSLVYTSLAGFAPDHPRPTDAAHDINALAMSGLAAATMTDGAGPQLPSALVADVSLAALAATTTLAAVLRAKASGLGCRLQLSLLDAALWTSGLHLAVAETGTVVGPERNITSGSHAGYGYYQCADGEWLAVGALETHLWRRLLVALGCDESLDPLQSRKLVAEAFLTNTRAEWMSVLAPLDVCVSPVLDYAQVVAAPPRPLYDAPAVVDGERPAGSAVVPDRPGRHTLHILRAAGVSDHDINEAVRAGALDEGDLR